MIFYHLLFRLFKQKKQCVFIGIHCLYFIFLGFVTHAKEIQKITTPHFKISFDKVSAKLAQKTANTLETIYKPVSKTLGIYPPPVPLFIDNSSTICNAHFTNIPRHMYFSNCPSPDPNFIGNADWLNMLCLHEFRHTVQHAIQYYSTPLLLRPLYFWCNLAAGFSLIPSRFFQEGDAVGIETALSKTGRGRFPGWERLYKVNLLERDPISLERQIFGSLKHEVTSEYHIGYYFTTYIRRKYGADAIKSIFQKTVRGVPFFSFYHAIKKVTKRSIQKLYQDMNQDLLRGWKKQLQGLHITPATQVTVKKPTDSIHYTNPFIDISGNLFAWKEGIGLRNQLVHIRGVTLDNPTWQHQTTCLTKDRIISFYYTGDEALPPAAFAIGQGCAAWLEVCPHPFQRDIRTTRLQYYDFKQRKRRTLIATSRYRALAMSPSTNKLVAVSSDPVGNNFLVVLDTKSGKKIKVIDNPDNTYYLTPSWSDEDHIVVVQTKDEKNSIVRINVVTGALEILLPYTYEHRSYPKLYKDYLLYNSSYNGIDNIYAMDLATKNLFQVTSRKYGAYLGMVDSKTNQLIFNDYTKNGMDIAVMPFDPLLWTPLAAVEDRSLKYYEPLVTQEQDNDILKKVTNHIYPVSKYSFLRDNTGFIGPNIQFIFNEKSIYIDLFRLESFYSRIQIQPYLFHSYQNAGIQKSNNLDKTTTLGLKAVYKTLHPVLKIDFSGNRYRGTGIQPNHSNGASWRPALSSSIKFPYYFTLGSSDGKVHLRYKHFHEFDQKSFYKQMYTFKIKNNSTRSKRDLTPPWSQILRIDFNDASKSRLRPYIDPNIYTLDFHVQLSCPSVFSHHYFSLSPRFIWLKNKTDQSYWRPLMRISYGLPLLYPESGIPMICFLQKIWLVAYYNFSCDNNYAHIGTNRIQFTRENSIGLNLACLTRAACNTSLPPCQCNLQIELFQKVADKWILKFSPNFEVKIDLGRGKM